LPALWDARGAAAGWPGEAKKLKLELRVLADGDPQLSLQALATGSAPADLDSLLPVAPALAGIECYLCGPPAMIAAVRLSLRKRGVTPRHIHFENFGFR